MTGLSPFTLTVFSRSFQRLGWIGAPLAVECVPRHNAIGYTKITVPSDDVRVPYLMTDGARMTVDYLGEQVMSGRVSHREGAGPAHTATITVTVEDDLRLLTRMLGWPNPAGGIDAQGAATAYHTVTGPAETVLKTVVTANKSRTSPAVTVAADSGRGSAITASLRMHPVSDRVLPLVDAAGIGVTVRQQGTGLVLDCYTPTVRAQPLSEDAGTVVDWSWSQEAPAATRVVVGGQGEGTAREFVHVTDSGREAAWGESIEVFRDARDSDDTAVLTLRGQETLTEGAAKAGLSLTLAETAGFAYGRSVRVGDVVTTALAPGVEVTDTLREARIVWDAENGLTATPVVGERTDDPGDMLRGTLQALTRAVRDLRATR